MNVFHLSFSRSDQNGTIRNSCIGNHKVALNKKTCSFQTSQVTIVQFLLCSFSRVRDIRLKAIVPLAAPPMDSW